MTPEDSPQTVESVEAEIDPRELFLRDLYDRVLTWMQGQGGKIAQEWEGQTFGNWRNLGPKHPQQSGLMVGADVEKAVLLRSPRRDFALALGRGLRSHYSRDPSLSLQFGMSPRSKGPKPKAWENETEEEEMYSLLNQEHFTYGSGEFVLDDYFNDIEIHCWANSRLYGGKDWGKSRSREIPLNEEGLEACLDVVKRVDRQAFV